MMSYLILAAILFVFLLIYFKIAQKFNIIDKPNERSSHTEITLRGGGVIYPLAFLLFIINAIVSLDRGQDVASFWTFGLGLFLICTISFIDDMMDLSSKIRLVFHFISVSLLLYFIQAFTLLPIWMIPLLYVFIIGILNAFNFMDGINGITGCYSIIVLGALLYVNQFINPFTDPNFIVFPMIASLVFLFFNFRKRAKTFMGDIGSLGIGFWIVALLGLLMVKSGELKYILFLGVYGIDVIATIIERLRLKENIFKAHRKHLYQLLANEKKMDHRVISFFYAVLQAFICFIVILIDKNEAIILPIIIFLFAIIYLYLKNSLKRKLKTN